MTVHIHAWQGLLPLTVFTQYEGQNYCQVKFLVVKKVDVPVLEIKKKISGCPYAKCRATKPLNLVALKIDRPWHV